MAHATAVAVVVVVVVAVFWGVVRLSLSFAREGQIHFKFCEIAVGTFSI
jgi:hypothetical protein